MTDVRQGKQFVIQVEGEITDERREQLHALAAELLCNPVIEDFILVVEEDQ